MVQILELILPPFSYSLPFTQVGNYLSTYNYCLESMAHKKKKKERKHDTSLPKSVSGLTAILRVKSKLYHVLLRFYIILQLLPVCLFSYHTGSLSVLHRSQVRCRSGPLDLLMVLGIVFSQMCVCLASALK